MKNKIKLLMQSWFIHYVLVLAAVNLAFILQYVRELPSVRMTPWQYFIKHTFYDADSLVILFSLLFMEINYQFLLKKIRFPFFIFSCLLVGLLSVTILYYLHLNKFEDRNIPLHIAFYVGGYALVYAVIRDYFYNTRHKKDIQLQQSKNELDALKAQLNPHFLFNSLNYLYGTALIERAPHTADGVDKLSQMMRYTITGIHENFVLLEEELKFIKHYIELQQARLPEKESIKINIQYPSSTQGQQIAPLLLLPFIENAFKYGISMDEPCFVNINITLSDTILIMEVSNSITRSPIEIKGNNTGIKNTIKRLQLLYPDKYKLQQINRVAEYTTLFTLSLIP